MRTRRIWTIDVYKRQAYLAADWLVRGLVCHYYGQPVPQRVKVPAVLDAPLGARPGFEHLARLVARDMDGVLHAAPVPNSATLAENIRSANAFLAVPAGVRYEVGDKADIEPVSYTHLGSIRCPACPVNRRSSAG